MVSKDQSKTEPKYEPCTDNWVTGPQQGKFRPILQIKEEFDPESLLSLHYLFEVFLASIYKMA